MFVLGIDPGLTRTGFGLVRRGHPPTPVSVGVIKTDPEESVASRLAVLYTDLVELIDEHRPEVMAIEQVFSNRNLHTVMAVGRASGIALLAAAQAGIPVHEYTPTTVKLSVTGDGNADKRQVQQMVIRRLGLSEPPRPADAADALAVALCHLQSLRVDLVPGAGRGRAR